MPEPLAQSEIAAIRTPASYELVVDQLRRGIQVGRFLPGDKLPTERELAGHLGVSRTTVREAMRVLQGEGLIETRRGRAGGAVVVGVQGTPAERRQLLRRRMAELENLFDYRVAVEPAAARLAARHRTKAELARIRTAMEALSALAAEPDQEGGGMAAPARFFARDADYHQRIAVASHNPLMVKAVEDARAAMFLPVGAVFTRLDPAANEGHAAIFGAIERKDDEAAGALMLEHLHYTRESIRRMAHESRAAAPARVTGDGRQSRSYGGRDAWPSPSPSPRARSSR